MPIYPIWLSSYKHCSFEFGSIPGIGKRFIAAKNYSALFCFSSVFFDSLSFTKNCTFLRMPYLESLVKTN